MPTLVVCVHVLQERSNTLPERRETWSTLGRVLFYLLGVRHELNTSDDGGSGSTPNM